MGRVSDPPMHASRTWAVSPTKDKDARGPMCKEISEISNPGMPARWRTRMRTHA